MRAAHDVCQTLLRADVLAEQDPDYDRRQTAAPGSPGAACKHPDMKSAQTTLYHTDGRIGGLSTDSLIVADVIRCALHSLRGAFPGGADQYHS